MSFKICKQINMDKDYRFIWLLFLFKKNFGMCIADIVKVNCGINEDGI